MEDLLRIKGLELNFNTSHGVLRVLDKLHLNVAPGEIFGIAGESGSGKSMTAMAIMGLIEKKLIHSVSGEIIFHGQNILALKEKEQRFIRGNKIGMIFQEPMTSLNPVFSVGEQIREALVLHQNITKKEADMKAKELLSKVGIPEPEKRLKNYPHELSGGMRQRVMIAIAISCKPDILIADEPTTALDTTVQAQIFDLLLDIQRELNTAIILITHDMGVMAEMADKIAVMYAGRVVEQGLRDQVLDSPMHPYTQSLISCIPTVPKGEGEEKNEQKIRLQEIPGLVPSLHYLRHWPGCSFSDRCPKALEQCSKVKPDTVLLNTSQSAACLLLKK